ncbi:tryptophan 2,3-dioxygenase family protein [soil metagenome]|nr:tryptophan 2,3-dioxygenase [Gemmatimonadota bacterium]
MKNVTSFGLPVPEGGGHLTYGEYLKIREMMDLLQLRSEPAQHDETLFIIIHQSYELWFRQIIHELDAIMARLAADQVLEAQRLLGRCIEIQRVLVSQVSVLETMTPMDFLAFRDHLTPASGFQSAQFREIEFVSGLKNPYFLGNYPEGSQERDALERRLAEPSLRDVFFDLLRRRGFDLPPDAEGASAEEARESPPHLRRVSELARLYREFERHPDLFLLAERMIEYDEMFARWRLRHVLMVERMIGSKPGTGGSAGAAYLRRTAERKFFPELWELRSELGAQGGGYGA